MAKIKQYGRTPWGSALYAHLVRVYDNKGRLTRGKTYFNQGAVHSLSIKGSMVTAKIKGSGGVLYSLSLEFEPFNEVTKGRLIEMIKGEPLIQSALLNGVLPESLMHQCVHEGIDLFGMMAEEQERDAYCSCPDMENPCKHIFAVLLALNAEIDHNPLLLFSLHGLDLAVALDSLGGNEIPSPIVFAPWESTMTCDQPLEIFHHENALPLIDSLLLPDPAFAPIDYKEVMREFYKTHTKSLSHIIAPIFDEDTQQLERFFHDAHCECHIDEMWQNGSVVISHPLLKPPLIAKLLAPYVVKQTQEGCVISLLHFVTLFLSFHGDEGGKAYRYYHALSKTLYLLLHANAFIPTVVKDQERPRFFIGWMPLLTPASVYEQIQRLACHATAFVRFGHHESFANGYSGTLLFLSKAMGEYVHEMNFMHKRLFMNPPPISQSFFQGRPFTQKEGGKPY